MSLCGRLGGFFTQCAFRARAVAVSDVSNYVKSMALVGVLREKNSPVYPQTDLGSARVLKVLLSI